MRAASSYPQTSLGWNSIANNPSPELSLPLPGSLAPEWSFSNILYTKQNKPPSQFSGQRAILARGLPKQNSKNICKKKILVSGLLTAVAKGQIFHDAIPQRSCFSGQSLTLCVKKLWGGGGLHR